MKHILFISYDGMTDPLGQSQVLPYLIGLSKYNIKYTLISFEKDANYAKKREDIEKICIDANIQWTPLRYTKKPPVVSTLWDYFKMRRKSKQLQKEIHFEIVHCRSYISALVGLWMKKKYKVKFLFDMRGFWADERVDGNLWNLKNPIYKAVYTFFKNKERTFLEKSDLVVSLTQAGRDEMLTWNIPNLTAEKIFVIPCTADFELFRQNTKERRVIAKELLGFSASDFVLSYIGSIGTWYLLEEMVVFFAELKISKPDAKFLILTPDKPELILSVFEKFKIKPTDVVIKFSERKFIPDFAHASDMNIFFIKPVFSKISSSPTKMGEVLAMGIPIICNSNVGDVEQIIKDTGAGICIRDFKKETMRMAIHDILDHGEYDAAEIREKSKKIFDLQHGIDKYKKTYELLLNQTL